MTGLVGGLLRDLRSRRGLAAVLGFCIFTVAFVFAGTLGRRSATDTAAARSEPAILESATRIVLPEYVQSSLEQGMSGVAVASVAISPEGRVTSVVVLEAPDTALGRAVAAALRQWRFTPFQPVPLSGPMPVSGKLTIYFVLSDGRGVVLTSEQQIRRHVAEENSGLPPRLQ